MLSSQFGVPISHIARQVSQEDFYNFTYILASDNSNLDALRRMRPHDSTAEVRLWGSYFDGAPIADPYYGGIVSWRGVECHECKTKPLCRKDLKIPIINAFNYPTHSWIRWRMHPPLLCDSCLDPLCQNVGRISHHSYDIAHLCCMMHTLLRNDHW